MRRFLTILVTLTACSSTKATDTWQEHLNAARTRWLAATVLHYDYRYRFLCGECPPGIRNERLIMVRGGAVISVRDVEADTLFSGDLSGYTIAGEFARIQGYIDRPVAMLSVQYDPVLGYPTSVSVDPITDAVDDEHGHVITSLQPIPGP